jgi:two-component system cell cycle sensor histidine kinase/response regulator CckA
VSDLAFGLLLAALAGVTWWLVRSRDSRPMVLWMQGWSFLFASMAALLIGGEAPWPAAVVHLLGPFFPSLLLAGTLAHAGRPVPSWLAPLAFALGIMRWGLGQSGLEPLDHGIALVFEAGFALAAAFLAFRVARRSAGPRSQQLLAPAFLVIAAIEAADALWGIRGLGLRVPHLVTWVLVGPFTLMAQLAVTRDRALGLRRQVEQALGESEERFRALTDNAFDLVAEMDPEGRFTYANPRYEEWLGRPGETLIGTRGLDLVHPEDRERTLAWFRAEDIPAGETLLTIRARHRDGAWRWVETSKGIYRAGGAVRVVVNSRDVSRRMELDATLRRTREELEVRVKERTAELNEAVAELEEEVAERHRVEHELRLSEERWRNLSELSSDMSYAIAVEPDGSLTLEWITQAVSRISGYSVDEINQRGWRSLLHPEDADRIAPHVSRVPEGETREVEGRIIARDGGIRWLRVRVTGARSPVDGKLRVLGAIRDITEARRAEEEQRHLEAKLREAQKLESLGILAGGIAHDFNNLLAVILGNESLATSEAEAGSRLAKQLDRIRSAAKHAEALTHQMLTYSGRASISLEPFDLSELVEQMRDLLEASTSKKCRLEISLEPDGSVVEGDPTQLRQVIMNLVTNASESLQDRSGSVAVRTGVFSADAASLARAFGGAELAEGEYVYLEVSDTGEGMEEEVSERIFEPYFSTKFAGRGLGLASVLGIVRGHRGAIELVTAPGRGTSFRVLLPPATHAAVPAPSQSRPRGAPAGGGTILVIDDEEWVLELAQEFLERSEFEVVTAGGGREALEILRGDLGKTIDAVVLDLTMPDLNGQQTFREIRALRPGLPVIVVSGFGEEATADRFPPDEIAAFVRKPYEPEDLVDAIRASLGG